MAFWWISLNVYNSNWTSSMYTNSASTTFQNVLDALKTWQFTGWAGFNEGSVYWTWQEIWLSLTEWWTPLTLSSLVTSVFPEETGWTLYALYPELQAETVTGFFLDWTEYKFEWWWIEYHAWEWISIWNITKNWRQWPSPDGFHVPSTTEWQGVKTIMNWLSLTTWNNWRINLHMPFAGRRGYYDGIVYGQGGNARYWSSSPRDGGPEYAWYLYFNSNNVNPSYNNRAHGQSLRCFKDSYVAPDSTWTTVQGTLWSAWIFWNQSEWLISITDGSTGYTMMDKNLWATTVYNDWDTLSEANCGKYYQWWNNYGFPWTGSVTTSSTQVDASAYWPNTANWYYSSGTFITWSNDWSSVHNDDLWWNTTGTITQENVISNTGVTSVNGQTGDVAIDDNTKIFVVNESALTSWWSISNVEPFKNICERLMSNPKHIAYITNKHSIMPGELIGSVMQIISHSGNQYDEDNWAFSFIYIWFPFAENSELFKYYWDIQVNGWAASVANITANKINFTPSNSWTAGQVLTKTSSNYEWKDASWWLQVAPNSPITWIKYLWYGTEEQYAALTQYYTDTPWDTEFRCF